MGQNCSLFISFCRMLTAASTFKNLPQALQGLRFAFQVVRLPRALSLTTQGFFFWAVECTLTTGLYTVHYAL